MKKLLMLSLAVMIGLSFFSTLSIWAEEDPPVFDFKIPSEQWFFDTPNDVAIDSLGNIYVSDKYHFRIQKFDSDGKYLTEWGSQGTGDGQFEGVEGLTVDSSGNVYVADKGANVHRIQKFDSDGNFLTKWGDNPWGNKPGEFASPLDVATDSSGNVYVADYHNHRIQIFNSNGDYLSEFPVSGEAVSLAVVNNFVYVSDRSGVQKFDLAGTFQTKIGTRGDGVDDGDGEFYDSRGVAVDSSENVYVVDMNNRRVQKFDSSGNFVTKWGSDGRGDGQFKTFYGIAVDSSGNVYVADSFNDRIQKFDSNGNFQSKMFFFGDGDGQFMGPWGLASDSSGNVYVADRSNQRIQKIDSSGNFVTKWRGDGEYYYPTDVATDSFGDVYVADSTNNRIQKFDSSGNLLMEFGELGSGDGQFIKVQSVAVDISGNIFALDWRRRDIQKFDSSGNHLLTFGGNGYFSRPFGLSVDTSGKIYVASTLYNHIKIFDSEGGFLGTMGDGELYRPYDVSVDSIGNVYVADSGNSQIKKFDSSGTILTEWGSQGTGDGQFINPRGVTLDSSGDVWVSDSGNHRIQKFIYGWTPVGNDVEVEDYLTDTTVVFDNVIDSGVTTVTVSESNPGGTTSGFRFLGTYYDISTTASFDGNITITLTYDDADVHGKEEKLKLFHYDDGHWVAIDLVIIDTVNNTITGTVEHLSWFAVAEQTVVDVEIDIKPGSDDLNCIKASSKGTIPVAILSTSDIDLSTIDVETIEIDDEDSLTDGVAWAKNSFKKDVDEDGLADRVFHFSTRELSDAELLGDDITLYVTGQLTDGTQIIGSDTVYLAGGPYCLD